SGLIPGFTTSETPTSMTGGMPDTDAGFSRRHAGRPGGSGTSPCFPGQGGPDPQTQYGGGMGFRMEAATVYPYPLVTLGSQTPRPLRLVRSIVGRSTAGVPMNSCESLVNVIFCQ